MRVAVLDTETTGTEESDQVVEVALVTLEVAECLLEGETLRVATTVDEWGSLARPTVPVLPEARANHHLTDEALALAPAREDVMQRVARRLSGASVLAAHNLQFDPPFLEREGVELPGGRLCPWRLARHLWPDAPRHGNQV